MRKSHEFANIKLVDDALGLENVQCFQTVSKYVRLALIINRPFLSQWSGWFSLVLSEGTDEGPETSFWFMISRMCSGLVFAFSATRMFPRMIGSLLTLCVRTR